MIMHSIFFWGSRFIDNLCDYFSDEVYIKNKMIDVSLISDHHYSQRKNDIVDWRSELNEIWEKEAPEYFVLDLHCVQKLLNVSPVTFTEQDLYQCLKSFIELVGLYFDKGHIILIKTYVPKYYVIDTQLRRNNKQFSQQLQALDIVRKAESLFSEITGAITVDLTKYYFYEKEAGYVLTNYIYEKECFQDIFGKINDYISGGVVRKNFTRPDFSICLQRYCKYYACTIWYGAFTVFLDEQDLFESMILASSREFVVNYLGELLELYKLIQEDSEHVSAILEHPKTDVEKIFSAYNAVIQEDYRNEQVDYPILFRNEVVSQSVLLKIRKCCQEQGIAKGKLINPHNAGYYFARMIGFPDKEALKFVKEGTVLQPILVDVFGSCISRTCLRERFTNNHICAVNNYWFQIPAYETVKHPIQYPTEVFEGREDGAALNVKIQFDHTIGKEIEKSEATWLIVDLYSIITPKTYRYHDLVYTDFYQKISAQLGAECVDIAENKSLMGNYDDIVLTMLPWCQCVKRKYGNHIILLDLNSSLYSIGDDDVIYEVGDKEKITRKNELAEKAYEFVKKETGCYCIKIACGFMADDKGYHSRVSVHYSLCYYQIIFNIVKKIMMEEPQEHFFDSYPVEIRLDRIRRLLPKNNPRFLRKIFSDEADNWVLQLPIEMINKYHNQIVNWYDFKIGNKEMLLKMYENYLEYEDLIKVIQNMEEDMHYDDAYILPKKYKQYDDNSLLFNKETAKHFIVKYDGNGADAGSMKCSVIVWGIKTRLCKNKFQKKGYRFTGWKSQRMSDKKTCYVKHKKRHYYLEKQQPEGYELYYYPDECVVSKLSPVDNDEIILYTQWEAISNTKKAIDNEKYGKALKKEGRQMRRVMTYGTYDLIQYEDIEFLRQAKALGDYLIVVLPVDELGCIGDCRDHKISYEKRRKMLEALRYVDLVIPINDWWQLRSDVHEYHINIFVMENEWNGKFDILKEEGCDVVYLHQPSGNRDQKKAVQELDWHLCKSMKAFQIVSENRKDIEAEYKELAEQNGIAISTKSVNDNYYNKKIDKNSILICGLGVNVRGNMQYILNELNHNDKYSKYKIYVRTKGKTDEIVRGYIKQNGWVRTETVPKNYSSKLESCEYLITESYFPYSWIKRSGQIVINLWHGAPLKCIGFAKKGKYCHVNGSQQKNFLCADYLLYPNPYTKEKMLSSYRVESLLSGKALLLGYPRTGGMLSISEERQKELRKELAPSGAKIYAYMPTWKGYLDNEEIVEETKNLLKYLDQNLQENQILYVNLHHKISDSLDYKYFKHIRQFPPLIDSYELLAATDALITDYSSVFYDYLASRKQIILDLQDYKAYLQHQGLYIDVETLPFDKAYSPKEIINALNRGKMYDDTKIFEEMCRYDSDKNARKLCQIIGGEETGLNIQEHPKNNKYKVLIYSHYFEVGKETDILEKITEEYDKDKYEIYLSCNQEAVSETISSNQAYPLLYENNVIGTSSDETWITSLGKSTKELYESQIISFAKAMELLKYDYALVSKRFYGDTKFSSILIYDVLDPEIILGLALADSPVKVLFLSEIYNDCFRM